MTRENLAAARKRRGLTQAALAEELGIRREAYRRYENGEQTPNVELALRMARVLGTTVEAIFSTDTTEAQLRDALEQIVAGLADLNHGRRRNLGITRNCEQIGRAALEKVA